jgi:hypothetical protein
VVAAVELRPGGRVDETVVGGDVHDDRAAAGQGAEGARETGRVPVRQREDDGVVTGQGVRGGGADDAIGQGRQLGLVHAEAVARAAARRDGPDHEVRVPEEETERLAAGVPGGTRDGHDMRHDG